MKEGGRVREREGGEKNQRRILIQVQNGNNGNGKLTAPCAIRTQLCWVMRFWDVGERQEKRDLGGRETKLIYGEGLCIPLALIVRGRGTKGLSFSI